MRVTHPLLAACEIQDWVVTPEVRLYRRQNRAANDELLRRGRESEIEPSGDVFPYAIEWVDTCSGASTIQLPDTPFVGPYGGGYYGGGVYGGQL